MDRAQEFPQTLEGPRHPPGPSPWLRSKQREWIAGYLFSFPALMGIGLFSLGPMLYALYMSFHDVNIISPVMPFVGLQNYENLVQDQVFWTSVRNSAYFTVVVVPIQSTLALALAFLINQRIRGRILFRASYFMPVVISTVVAASVWQLMYDPTHGLLNSLLHAVGIPGQPWLGSSVQAMPAVMLMCIWKTTGFFMIIFLAGLQEIPNEFYEAARIDGAGGGQLFRLITLPLLQRTSLFVLVITTMDALRVFTQIYVMTGGGPANATSTIVFYIWRTAFRQMKMGDATAMAFVLFVLIFLLTLCQLAIMRSGREKE